MPKQKADSFETKVKKLRESYPYYPSSVARRILSVGAKPILLGIRGTVARYRFPDGQEVLCETYGQVWSDYPNFEQALSHWERAEVGIQTSICEVRFDPEIHHCVSGSATKGQRVIVVSTDQRRFCDLDRWPVVTDLSLMTWNEMGTPVLKLPGRLLSPEERKPFCWILYIPMGDSADQMSKHGMVWFADANVGARVAKAEHARTGTEHEVYLCTIDKDTALLLIAPDVAIRYFPEDVINTNRTAFTILTDLKN